MTSKQKEKSGSTQRETVHYLYRNTNSMRADFSSETMKARKKWLSSFQAKEKNCQPEILYPGKIFFRNEGERAVIRWSKIKREAILAKRTWKMIRSALKRKEIITGECLKFQNGKKKWVKVKVYIIHDSHFYEFYNPYLKLETTIKVSDVLNEYRHILNTIKIWKRLG